MSSIIHCVIDRKAIENATKKQKDLSKRITLVDPSGLRLAINTKSASWTYNYRKRGLDFDGKRHPQRTIKLGDLISLTPQEARTKVEEIKSLVRNGQDPAEIVAKQKTQQKLEEYRDRPLKVWLKEYRANVLQDKSEYKLAENMHISNALVELQLSDNPPKDMNAKAFRDIVKIHIDRPATAKQRFGALSRFIDYLVDEEIIERNPSRDLSLRHKPKASQARSNYFSTKQLYKLWYPAHEIKPTYLRFLRFMIVCPLRRSEAANLSAKNIFENEMELRLSAAETKNKEAFSLPLPDLAFSQFGELSELNDQRIFQLSSKRGAAMKSWSFFTASIRKSTEVETFNLHDLRRTFTSLLSEHSPFSESLVDSLLNHKRSSTRTGVMRAYQHAKNLKQRREIMEWWSDFLEREVINDDEI